jgi:hypothetical protein
MVVRNLDSKSLLAGQRASPDPPGCGPTAGGPSPHPRPLARALRNWRLGGLAVAVCPSGQAPGVPPGYARRYSIAPVGPADPSSGRPLSHPLHHRPDLLQDQAQGAAAASHQKPLTPFGRFRRPVRRGGTSLSKREQVFIATSPSTGQRPVSSSGSAHRTTPVSPGIPAPPGPEHP